jgi:uncharacterized protein with HEPN domain
MRTPRVLLQDILESIAEITESTPTTDAEFAANKLVQSHVLRHIAIIGEAASRLPHSLRDANPIIPWRRIIDMRNILIHAYHGINWHRVYETARNDVPVLKVQVEAILASFPPDSATP